MRRVAILLGLLLLVPSLLAFPAEAQEANRCQRVNPARFFWHYQCVKAEFDRLQSTYPNIAKYYEVGKSVLNNPIYVLEIANLELQKNGTKRPGFYLDATHHGNEIQGTEAAMILAQKLTSEYGKNATVTQWVDDFNIYINPVINPDGNNANQRYNANSVDLNRNYPYQHGARAANAGASGASEPETKANVAFMRTHDLDVYLSLHTGTWDYVVPRCSPNANRERLPTDDEPLMNWTLHEILGASGMPYRGASGTGESICWAYDVLEVWSLLPEVTTEQGALFSVQETQQLNRAMLGIYWVLSKTGGFGSNLHMNLTASDQSATGVALRLSNTGHQVATNWTLEVNYEDSQRAPLLKGNQRIEPGAQILVPIPKNYLQGNVIAKLDYQHLNVNPLVSEPATGRPRDPHTAYLNFTQQAAAVVARSASPAADSPLPDLFAVAALAAVAFALRRRT